MANSKDEATTPEGTRRQKLSRRLLGKVGATGLMTAAGVFATSANAQKAHADPLCCELANYPENVSFDWCYNNADYIWYCSANAYLHCTCCEANGNSLSAADCRYN